MKVLYQYINGNYHVVLFQDGTKIRFNNLDNLTPKFAESIDCTITTECDGGCAFCYLNCGKDGKHADLHQPFFDTLHYGQELALNGNDLTHPELEDFLKRMKAQHVVCNLTVNQKHFMREYDRLMRWKRDGLIYGIGVSLVDSSDKEFLARLSEDCVLHTIDGLLTETDIKNLSNHNIKLLILGYKILGRGDLYYAQHREEIQRNIDWIAEHILELKDAFRVVSFDNLAIEHIKLRDKLPDEIWQTQYMGDEGQYTFFIDAVHQTYATSSLEKEQAFPIASKSVDEMFNHIYHLNHK